MNVALTSGTLMGFDLLSRMPNTIRLGPTARSVEAKTTVGERTGVSLAVGVGSGGVEHATSAVANTARANFDLTPRVEILDERGTVGQKAIRAGLDAARMGTAVPPAPVRAH